MKYSSHVGLDGMEKLSDAGFIINRSQSSSLSPMSTSSNRSALVTAVAPMLVKVFPSMSVIGCVRPARVPNTIGMPSMKTVRSSA